MKVKVVPFKWGEQNMTRYCREIRDKVFLKEQRVPFPLEHAGNSEARFYLAYVDRSDGRGEVPAGCARYRITPQGYKLERFAVLPEFRNGGVGKALVNRVMHDVSSEQTYLHAQESARRFWEQNGFEVCREPFFEADIRHFHMKAAL
ncbi:MAG: GNAT family N-acetyltransferase [Flavobacteriales bacterium]|nr:GNAT family N-acetyltransferase [Flavobacteriales bacterium]